MVVDNEKFDGKINKTEALIRKINNPRILYYRNCEQLRPGDNFNRGILLARGQWVSMLHDDDILTRSALKNLGKIIHVYSRSNFKKELGAISALYYQFYDSQESKYRPSEIDNLDAYLSSLPTNYALLNLTHRWLWFTSHLGD
ncbi:glycosyltransferase family 2 protein [Desulfobaculum bizertense]|uniref:glycosyltransferase family 2 protein n=1 Tax=Desulfobaculum bizertense TaxID=376490 RepID=UPI0025460185|nr:glycosyltransferase [Desulfobaculum bizertense]